MGTITKREYQVISLYARGLTFKEIGYSLSIATRTAINFYMRVKKKDKGRVTRAKKSRAFNKSEFKANILQRIQSVKEYNRHVQRYYSSEFWRRYKPLTLKCIDEDKDRIRLEYITESLIFAFKSYHRFRLNLLKKGNKKEQ